MNEADNGVIEERLARLERGVKRGKRATTATMGLLVLLIAWSVAARGGKARAADSGATALIARSLAIVDDRGNARVVLMINKDGPGVALVDEKGTPRVLLEIAKDGPSVDLNDEKGRAGVVLVTNKDGPGVFLYGEKRKAGVDLVVTRDGPSVSLDDEKGNARAVLGTMPLEAVHTGATEITAPSSLTLFDKESKVIWRAP